MEEALSDHKGMRPYSSKIRINPLYFPSETIFREQFDHQIKGTLLEGIRLEIVWLEEKDLSLAGNVFLESIEVISE
jgi:hypothetical protein